MVLNMDDSSVSEILVGGVDLMTCSQESAAMSFDEDSKEISTKIDSKTYGYL